MDAATYQVRKRSAGGFAVSFVCPNCATTITSPLIDAGTAQPCPTCSKTLVVPGKANLDRLRAKLESDRRKAEQARQHELQEETQRAELAAHQADADRAQAEWDEAEDEDEIEEERIQAFWKTHCRYCFEEIKENAKKCKNCCEFLDEELRAEAMEQVVARFQPPLKDVFWLAAKFWAVSLLFAFAGYLLYLGVGAVIARMH